MAYERSIYSDMYRPNNMFGVTNTNAANNLNNQFAFRPGSLKDTQIKNQQMYKDEGYPAPKLDQLKQEDWDQFQKKQIPLSLDRNLYKGVEGWTANAGNVMNDANILQPDFSKVNKASMIPEGFIDKMKSLYGGITNTDAAQTMNTGNKYANLADDAWANKQVIRTPGGEIVVDTESGQVAPDIAGFPGDEIQEQVTETTPNVFNPGVKHSGMAEGIKDPNMWDKFKGMFQRPEAKQKEFEAYEASMNPQGWGDFGDYKGNIWEGSGGNKINVVDPVTGATILQNKNFDSMFGSESVEEMIAKKEAWARNRRAKGKEYLSKDMNAWLDAIDKGKGGTDGPGKGPGTYGGPKTYDFNPSITSKPTMIGQGPLHGATTGYQSKQGSHHYMRGGRVGYHKGGRVGILSVF